MFGTFFKFSIFLLKRCEVFCLSSSQVRHLCTFLLLSRCLTYASEFNLYWCPHQSRSDSAFGGFEVTFFKVPHSFWRSEMTKNNFSISQDGTGTYCGHHRLTHLKSSFLMNIKFSFDFQYFLAFLIFYTLNFNSIKSLL